MPSPSNVTHQCIVNLGLFRSGTTTLAKAADTLGMKTSRTFPELTAKDLRQLLVEPSVLVQEWWQTRGGRETLTELVKNHDFVCDGWIAVLVYLDPEDLLHFKKEVKKDFGVRVRFVATTRDVTASVRSELQHWVIHDIERKSNLSFEDRVELESLLRSRAVDHADRILAIKDSADDMLLLLPLKQRHDWPELLSDLTHDTCAWQDALEMVGVQNANPSLPVEAILLTLRIGVENEARHATKVISQLLDGLEEDSLCRYLVVLGIDSDEATSEEVAALVALITKRPRVESCGVVVNQLDANGPFRICIVWHRMAEMAWERGADWVVLLGDDIEIDAPYHYRAFYRAFLDISDRLQCPFGLGCPWWNDRSFPGFPTFPAVGRAHVSIFGGLIPQNRVASFINQDLDPYLQRLYLKFGAAPVVKEAQLVNSLGGNNTGPARYDRVPAAGWRDWVLEDVSPIRLYLEKCSSLVTVPNFLLVDVVVPSYRLDLEFLERICSMQVPANMRTTFIVVVDNPVRLTSVSKLLGTSESDLGQAALALERHLVASSGREDNDFRGNNVRVRCNSKNLGASASRNRGLDESSAEYVLFLDDDTVPEQNMLVAYACALEEWQDAVGYVGLVRFPRAPTLSLSHAAVLMSYLTFMFEIADNPHYTRPAWGVTANILVKRSSVRFDTAYAKTGGGEDVDFCLRLSEELSGEFRACPSAVAHHPFWPGTPLFLSMHFYNWAIGDSALFTRFPEHCYYSWPNAVECLIFLIPIQLLLGTNIAQVLVTFLMFLVVDVAVEMADYSNYRHRCSLLEYERPAFFYITAHILANIYVLILETGRLSGHLKRGEVQHLTRRFDWHCNRLENSRRNFRRREQEKFVMFCAIVVMSFAHRLTPNYRSS